VRYSIILIPLFFLSLFCARTSAQVCGGNIGENIFTNGDFGSGSANILQTDPMIAPGYQYLLNTPLPDGYYNLSNDLNAWTNNYGSWLDIRDNSPDPNGYMMVVNANYQPGLFYEQRIEGLCENTLYVFTADVINLIRPEVLNHIKPNVSFLIDSIEFYTSGEIPQDAQWKTYGFTFATDPGQTSVLLSLRNNAPGGIGNDLALDNIEFRPCGPIALILPLEIENICEDGSPINLDATIDGDQYPTPAYQWQESFDQGQSWQNIPGAESPIYTHSILSSGYYYYRYLLANGPVNLNNSKCRVNSNVKIVYVQPKFWEITDTLCEGLSYRVEDKLYDQSGVYIDTLTSSIGCDSIVTLDLTFIPDPGLETSLIIEDPSCRNYEDGSISISSVINGTPPYSYTFNGIEQGSTQTYEALAAGEYTLVIEDRYTCTYMDTIIVQNPPRFYVDIGQDLTVGLGEQVQIIPISNYIIDSYQWSPEPPDCNADCLELEWYPYQSSALKFSASSIKGCDFVDSINIEVVEVRKVYIPNVFSPNNDAVNDHFTLFVEQPNVKEVLQLKIFNRWGMEVFQQTDVLTNPDFKGWDGKLNGKDAPEGIYTYYAEVLFLDDVKLDYSGDLLLMR
jgi:gliding motility-associated-like protein